MSTTRKIDCVCRMIHHPKKCPAVTLLSMKDSIDQRNRATAPCFMNCEKCKYEGKRLGLSVCVPHKCRYCYRLNEHETDACPQKERDEVNKGTRGPCIYNCAICRVKPGKGPHVCRSCGFTNNHATYYCPIAKNQSIMQVDRCFIVGTKNNNDPIVYNMFSKK